MLITSNPQLEATRLAGLYAQSSASTVSVSAIIAEVFTLLQANAASKDIMLINNTYQQVHAPVSQGIINFMVSNLVNNAIKYSNKGHVEVVCEHSGNSLNIMVKDMGIGMNDDQIEKIMHGNAVPTNGTFNESGSGIGLMLILEFLQLMHGHMHIDSIPDKGTSIKLSIPVAYC
jgi:signal transduction histidine kinase